MDKYKHNSNQNLKTKNLRYLSNKYTNLTLEGRHLLIKDFLCKEGYDNNIEFLQTGDRYFGRVYEDCRYKDGNQFVIMDNLLYKPLNNHYRLCVPTILLEKVIRRLHKSLLHCSKRKSKKTFRKYFFHPLAEIYITNYADRCVTCQCNSISQIPGKSLINGKPFIAKSSREILDISVIYNLPKSENYSNILLLVDRYTNYCISLPIRDLACSTLEQSLNIVFSTIGFPRYVQTDCNRDLNNALLKLTGFIPFGICSSKDTNIKIEDKLKKYIYDEDLDLYKSNWASLLPFAMDKINKLQIDGSHMTREEFFFKSTARNVFNMLGSRKIFEYVNNDNELMIKFKKSRDYKNRKNLKKLKTIHSGDIVLFTTKINPGSNTSNLQLDLFQVLKKNRKPKSIEIISLRTGQKQMTNKNLIRKIFVNEFISVNAAEKCVKTLFTWKQFTQPGNVHRSSAVCDDPKEKNTVNMLHTKSYIADIENMLESDNSFMDTEYDEWKQKPPDNILDMNISGNLNADSGNNLDFDYINLNI